MFAPNLQSSFVIPLQHFGCAPEKWQMCSHGNRPVMPLSPLACKMKSSSVREEPAGDLTDLTSVQQWDFDNQVAIMWALIVIVRSSFSGLFVSQTFFPLCLSSVISFFPLVPCLLQTVSTPQFEDNIQLKCGCREFFCRQKNLYPISGNLQVIILFIMLKNSQ